MFDGLDDTQSSRIVRSILSTGQYCNPTSWLPDSATVGDRSFHRHEFPAFESQVCPIRYRLAWNVRIKLL